MTNMNIKNLVLQKSAYYVVGGNKPYFTLSVPPAQDGGQWTVIGAFWLKEKNGKKFYSGSVDNKWNIEAEFTGELPTESKAYGGSDIPFD